MKKFTHLTSAAALLAGLVCCNSIAAQADLQSLQRQLNALTKQVQQMSKAVANPITTAVILPVSHQQGALPQDPILARGCREAGVDQVNDLHKALKCLNTVSIAPSGWVQIEVQDHSVQPYSQTVMINHPNGDRISISGHCRGRDFCQLDVAGQHAGMIVQTGHQLADLTGLAWQSTSSESPYGHDGIRVEANASLTANHLQVKGFYRGMWIEQGGQAALDDVSINKSVEAGIYLWTAAIATLNNVVLTQNGIGIKMAHNSTVRANHLLSQENNRNASLMIGSVMNCQAACQIDSPYSVDAGSILSFAGK